MPSMLIILKSTTPMKIGCRGTFLLAGLCLQIIYCSIFKIISRSEITGELVEHTTRKQPRPGCAIWISTDTRSSIVLPWPMAQRNPPADGYTGAFSSWLALNCGDTAKEKSGWCLTTCSKNLRLIGTIRLFARFRNWKWAWWRYVISLKALLNWERNEDWIN